MLELDIIEKWSDHYGERKYKLILNNQVFDLDLFEMIELRNATNDALPEGSKYEPRGV